MSETQNKSQYFIWENMISVVIGRITKIMELFSCLLHMANSRKTYAFSACGFYDHIQFPTTYCCFGVMCSLTNR